MDLLDRLHQRLLDALDRSAPRTAPPTIAEVYQRLVPYRTLRDQLEVSELAEYEHALLRLLGGERGLASVDDDAARADLQRELASINPILGVYRDHPEARVQIATSLDAPVDTRPGGRTGHSGSRAPSSADEATSGARTRPHPPQRAALPAPLPDVPATSAPRPATGTPRSAPTARPRSGAREAPPAEPPATTAHPPASADTPPAPAREADACAGCARTLPAHPAIAFCPFCGTPVGPSCRQCWTPLEPDWTFCLRCGARAG